MTDKKKSAANRARLEQAAIDRRQQDEASMRSRGIYLSDNERADLQAIDDKYLPLIDAAIQAEQAESGTRPDVNAFYQGISPERNPGEWKAAQKRAADAIRAWEASAPQAWKDARGQLDNLYSKRNKEANGVYRAAYERQYKELGNDPAEITKRAKEQISRLVTDQYNHYKELSKTAISMSAYDLVALGGKEWKLDAAETRKRILEALKPLHFKALGDNTAAIDEIKAYIEKALLDSPYIAKEGTPGTNTTVIFKERPKAEAIEITRTIYPLSHISPIDKVSNKIFTGELTDAITNVKMGKRGGGIPIKTTVQLYFSQEMFKSLPRLGLYEKAVYRGLCSVFKVGNRIMTDRMIYQAMTGNPEANLNPKQAEMINQSITKFMYTGAKIDMSEELKSRKIPGKLIHDENLIHAKRGTYNLNGTITTAIELFDKPLLLEVGESKDQIARLPMSAINTPVNKNPESIALQTYLLDRIYAMRGGKIDERRISYKTVYSEIWPNEADSKSRTQKKRLRGYMAKMLTHWGGEKDLNGEQIIKGFKEYYRGKTAQGVVIDLQG